MYDGYNSMTFRANVVLMRVVHFDVRHIKPAEFARVI